MIFLFDGDCAFCTSAANRLKAIVKNKIQVLPYQHVDLAKLGVTVEQCQSAVQYLSSDNQFSGSVAIAKALIDSKSFWSLAGLVMQIPVISSAGFLVYEWVANNRQKLPGGTPACAIPTDR
jgi:predicted DCC family thiol-disulfide oxidoreductase YuxK